MTRRVLMYSHDSFGLGHFRRTSTIAGTLTGISDDHEVLIVTGSPVADAYPLPARVDTVKLPAVTKDARGRYTPLRLGDDLETLLRVRAGLILEAFQTYAPDVVLVDHAPIGLAGELRPLLELTRSLAETARPRIVLGLRDIIDDADRVRDDWARSGTWDWLGAYDDVLVYGDEQAETTAAELELARNVRGNLLHTGYLAPTIAARREYADPYVLVTAGGGGDGRSVVDSYLEYLEARPARRHRSVIVLGPLMSEVHRAAIERRAAPLPGVTIEHFTPNMRERIAGAAAVVSMAGYNTVVEELAAGVPALLLPRCHPRLEQHLRAKRLSGITHLQRAPRSCATPARISDFVAEALEADRPRTCNLRLDGLRVAAAALAERAA